MRFAEMSRSGRTLVREMVLVRLGVSIERLGIRGNRTLAAIDVRPTPLRRPIAAG